MLYLGKKRHERQLALGLLGWMLYLMMLGHEWLNRGGRARQDALSRKEWTRLATRIGLAQQDASPDDDRARGQPQQDASSHDEESRVATRIRLAQVPISTRRPLWFGQVTDRGPWSIRYD